MNQKAQIIPMILLIASSTLISACSSMHSKNSKSSRVPAATNTREGSSSVSTSAMYSGPVITLSDLQLKAAQAGFLSIPDDLHQFDYEAIRFIYSGIDSYQIVTSNTNIFSPLVARKLSNRIMTTKIHPENLVSLAGRSEAEYKIEVFHFYLGNMDKNNKYSELLKYILNQKK